SRLEPEVVQLLNLIASSFNHLISPHTTVIGQVEEVDRADDDPSSDTAMSDSSLSSSLQPLPLTPTTLPHSTLHTRSLTQESVLHTAAATLIDSSQRLLSVVAQLRLHRTLHDRTRYAEAGSLRKQRMNEAREERERTRRKLEVDVRRAIEALEAH